MIAVSRSLYRLRCGLGLVTLLSLASLAPVWAAAISYEDWVAQYKLSDADAGVNADPDGDGLANALEYAYGTDPTKPDSAASVAPFVQVDGQTANFVYRVSPQSDGTASFQVMMSQDMKTWTPVPGTPTRIGQGPQALAYHPVPADGARFYALEVQIKTAKEQFATSIPIGANVGSGWEGLDPLSAVSLLTQPPAAADGQPNYTKYPVVAGASQTSFTSYVLDDFKKLGQQPPRRSWMGWFLWGNGTPPPGINPGYPVTGSYDGSGWDFFSYQYTAFTDKTKGTWVPVRLDQQPLFLDTWTLNYNWAPGMFGYVSKPLLPFPNQVHYWKDKQIVRGVNLSRANPFFYQYGDYVKSTAIPEVWRQAWFYLATRPLETAVVVPSNVAPGEMLNAGPWNAPSGDNDKFPYPVFDKTLNAANQTPFNIKVDRIDDFSADLVYEATRPKATGYDQNKYQRTAASNPTGIGNYMKMTVAQGSPLIWCETNNSKYAIFYNLIRTNLKGQINNNTGTNAAMVAGGPFSVPGVTGVKYVLLYGDQSNPNQWYQEVQPWYFDAPSEQGGGFNPSNALPYKTKSGGSITPPGQHNHTYTAIYYKEDAAEPVVQGAGTSVTDDSNGTDAQGNPYFFLNFKKATGKNFFVVGSVPEMRYYNTGVAQDDASVRDPAAIAWAGELGKYAFNFLTSAKVTWASTNMYQTTTTFTTKLANPYAVTGASRAGGMTADPNKTVMALNPHQYQKITLGPDQTKPGKDEVKWTVLRNYGDDFPKPAAPPNANKINSTTAGRWDYWNIRGNLKPIVTGSFQNVYPFQNFLPNMPAPILTEEDGSPTEFAQSGVAAVNITDVGTGYTTMPAPVVSISSPTGTGATFSALVDKNTGQIQQIDVLTEGDGYPDGIPAPGTTMVIAAPGAMPIGNGSNIRQAQAYAQVSGGHVKAVFMLDKGAGYAPIISVTQAGATDAAIVLPKFDKAGNMLPGSAVINAAGAGFDFSKDITVEVVGTGTGAKAQLVKPGSILDVTVGGSPLGGQGLYPLDPPNTNITPLVPPPPSGGAAQTVSPILTPLAGFIPAIISRGTYTSDPLVSYPDDSGKQVPLRVITGGKPGGGMEVINVALLPADANLPKILQERGYWPANPPYPPYPPTITSVKDLVFSGGGQTVSAVGKAYPTAAMAGALPLGSPAVGGYTKNVQIAFSGGDAVPPGVKIPNVTFKIAADGTITAKEVTLTPPLVGINYSLEFAIFGGRGTDALLQPVIDSKGRLLAVRVLQGGSHYNDELFAWLDDGKKEGGTPKAAIHINVTKGVITSVDVTSSGGGYSPSLVIHPISTLDPNGTDPNFANNPKGPPARFGINPGADTPVNMIIQYQAGANYIPGTENKATVESLPATIGWRGVLPFAGADPAKGYIGRVAPQDTTVAAVLNNAIISQYTKLTGKNLAPFGGSFQGNAAPDGYGLGGQISASGKFIGDLFNYQQTLAAQGQSVANTPVSNAALDAARTGVGAYDAAIYQAHNPFVTMTGALKSSVQGLQRTIALLYQDPPTSNTPEDKSENIWSMGYFSLFDPVGRVVVNPTATQPALGIVSSIPNPPAISADENKDKTGLSKWQPGMQWSGFGVSDQWNDQHYFYGYYLSTAALAGIFDQSWEVNPTKPGSLWAGPDQMGTAIDQWLLSIAYDPDNTALNKSLYRSGGLTYQKLSYFDQWNGHPWATGVSPGKAGDVERGTTVDNSIDKTVHPAVPWSVWNSYGTGNSNYNGENENSIFEGIQAWSAAILWGAATDRKPVVDLGMYLYSTNLAAGDAYFLDKNYNMAQTAQNENSWVPVTTIHSKEVIENGGNDFTPPNTSYNETSPSAFYTAPVELGGAASAGQSLTKKGENTLNNFFYAFPTGSKFIEAYPPAPWTLGMARNTNYMRKWAGAMMTSPWTAARDSALFQPADWIAMATTAAVCDVPYNPGDVPFPLVDGKPRIANYLDRLWSSWVTPNGSPGEEATLNPPTLPINVMTFLLSLKDYGVPDWTYIAKVTDEQGADVNDGIVFTASLTKQLDGGGVKTTFCVFNPGWVKRWVNFYRLNTDGSFDASKPVNEKPIAVGAKRSLTAEAPLP